MCQQAQGCVTPMLEESKEPSQSCWLLSPDHGALRPWVSVALSPQFAVTYSCGLVTGAVQFACAPTARKGNLSYPTEFQSLPSVRQPLPSPHWTPPRSVISLATFVSGNFCSWKSCRTSGSVYCSGFLECASSRSGVRGSPQLSQHGVEGESTVQVCVWWCCPSTLQGGSSLN